MSGAAGTSGAKMGQKGVVFHCVEAAGPGNPELAVWLCVRLIRRGLVKAGRTGLRIARD